MGICPNCRNNITSPSPENRYCPYCGDAFVSSCENQPCEGAIIVGESATCSVCGLVYRYQFPPLVPHLVRPKMPFGNKTVSNLHDLLPSSGDPEHEIAHLAHALPQFTLEAPQNPYRFQSRISRPVARHGRLYMLTQRGALESLIYNTLQRPANWERISLTPWRVDDIDSLRLQISDTIVYLVHNRQVKAFDAGTAAHLFELSVEDLEDPEVVISGDRVLVLGIQGGKQEMRLYDLPTLCDPVPQRKPLWKKSVDIYPGVRLSLPASRLKAMANQFYLITQSGEIITLGHDGEPFTMLYPNHAGAAVHAWAVGAHLGAMITCPASSRDLYGLVTFKPGATKAASFEQLFDVQPSAQSASLLTWEHEVLLLDTNGLLHRVSADVPGASLDTWDFIGGMQWEGSDMLHMLSWADRQYVFAHCQEGMSHRFRYAVISHAEKRYDDLPVRPHIKNRMSVAICGPFCYVCDLAQGEIHSFLIS